MQQSNLLIHQFYNVSAQAFDCLCTEALRESNREQCDRRLSMRALTNNLLQTVQCYGTSQCGQYRYEFTYELMSITKVSTQWYIGINILATSVS